MKDYNSIVSTENAKSAILMLKYYCLQISSEDCENGKCEIKDWCKRLSTEPIPDVWEVEK